MGDEHDKINYAITKRPAVVFRAGDSHHKINYEIAKHPAVLVSALRQCQQDGVPPPDWLVEAVEATIVPLSGLRPAQGVRSPDEAAWQFTTDYLRWTVVKVLRQKHKIPVREVFQAAADFFEDKLDNASAAGSAETIKKSYQRIERYNRKRG